jgi:sugar diacid utilization regulator
MSLSPNGESDKDTWGTEQLSDLYSLFVLSMMMFDGREAEDILRLASASAPSLGPCVVEATYLMIDGVLTRCPASQASFVELDELTNQRYFTGGRLMLSDGAWRWGFLLRGLGDAVGCLVVRADKELSTDQFFLLKVLGRQTATALANAFLHRRERNQRNLLRELSDERAAANLELSATVAKLRQQTSVHEVLTKVPASGSGEAGIADALHELTALPVAIEDRFGNLRAWSGPGEPAPYPKQSIMRREDLLRRATAQGHPIRLRDRLVSLAKPRHEVLGVISLVDPGRTAGQSEMFALEYSTTVLALELAHQRSLAEVELRLHRDLVDDLIVGTDEESAFARSDAIGHDLREPHYVIVVSWSGQNAAETVSTATRHALALLRLPALVARKSGTTIALVHGKPEGAVLHHALTGELGSDVGAIGVGGRCDSPDDFPRSYSEAVRALEIRRRSRTPRGATSFDELGVYRMFDTGESRGEVEAFVREWLGALLDYDSSKHADLVQTLSQYLECGGNYDETAATLLIHRSTLRYRLGRIREITDLDLGNVDTRLNLHVATRAWQVLQGPDEYKATRRPR